MGKNKTKKNVDGWRWTRLKRIANDNEELEKFRLNISNREVAPLMRLWLLLTRKRRVNGFLCCSGYVR